MTIACINDFREAARRRLPEFLFDYVDGGSFAEVTLSRNVSDLEAVALRQRVLRDVAQLDLSTELFGHKMAMPVALAPVGFAGLLARRGECQAVRAAEAAGVPFTLSTVSACTLEEVARAASKPFWFQLYMVKDRGFMRDMMAQAVEAGCSALLFTVDLPVAGIRYRDIRSAQVRASGSTTALTRGWQSLTHPRWLWDVGVHGRPLTLGNVACQMGGRGAMNDVFGWISDNFDPGISWRDLDFIRSEWRGPLVLKGILDVEDAREAAKQGVEGIIVSNHGGRQLDGALSTARALPPIADAVGDALTILADGGVRSGIDVLRLMALGAKGVLLGRAYAWALGAAGEAGVAKMLSIMEAEMRIAMALTGTASVREIDRTLLADA
ncbi:MAG: FMN-dependent L-lactate dehydrogenase LldD [Novosphingobium sp.]